MSVSIYIFKLVHSSTCQVFLIIMSAYFQPGFRDDDFFPLTVLAMTLGEISYVDNFVENNNHPFTIDSYIIVTIFMLVMPIALMNLLVSTVTFDLTLSHYLRCVSKGNLQ